MFINSGSGVRIIGFFLRGNVIFGLICSLLDHYDAQSLERRNEAHGLASHRILLFHTEEQSMVDAEFYGTICLLFQKKAMGRGKTGEDAP